MAKLSINSKIKLNSGHEIPQLGFGVYQTPAAESQRCCIQAFDAGYRHIDSAAAYRNEAGCGQAVKAGPLGRESVFFTSKIPSKKLSYESAQAQIQNTLKESGLEYIDLMLIHAPYGGSANRKGAWRAMVEAVEAGKIRSIGVSNYGVHHLDELKKHISELETERGGPGRGGVLSVGQWEIHPWCAREDIAEWCRQHNVGVEAYSPLVQGQRFGKEKVLANLAEKHGVTEAQVLIRWSLQKGYIPLPKSVTPERIKANADVYGFELTEEDMKNLHTEEYAPVCWDPVKSKLED